MLRRGLSFGVSMLYILLALSLGLMISTLVESQVAAMLSSGMALMAPTMIFSGLMFPIESMPVVLQWVSTLMPARWYIAAMRKIMIQGASLVHVETEILALTLMTSVLILVSLYKFKTRLE
ncbi:ABC transporter permease [Porphyromonas catoniae]|uniref:ABC transporter permease n=1 Tax=Porphyromonas catoniae TaxID=41976 RepID=UPI0028D17879|nr:ABC transporter permease [Porphyromonas catoniae]